MFGKNPIRAPESGDGSSLKVVEIFPTLQGEGPYAGWPAVFVRLGGCNLACDFCDTEFEKFSEMRLEEIALSINTAARHPREGGDLCQDGRKGLDMDSRLRGNDDVHSSGQRLRNLIVITGGEPLRQNIVPLCEALIAEGLTVQIETNGTLWRPLPEAVKIVCSPKMSNGKYHPLRDDLLSRTQALKFIVAANRADYRDVANVGQETFDTPVYVQPMDEYDPAKNAANIAHAAQLAQTHGYRLSLQLHKFLGIP